MRLLYTRGSAQDSLSPRHRRRLAPVASAMAVLGAVSVVAGFAAAPAMASAATPKAVQPIARVGSGYWHTKGNRIYDSQGHPFRIAGISWYGFETTDEVAHGLWSRDYHTIIRDIKNLGYNTIRIPFSNQMVEHPVVPSGISYASSSGPINTGLKGLNSLQILHKIISYAGRLGLKVILDDHRSEAGNSAEASGLWYTGTYTSQDWVHDWVTIAERYAGNSTVIGFDLRNEPHTPAGESYSQGATWGTGNPQTDVRLAYERAGNAILTVDPHALIFCEGTSANPNSSRGYDSTWWGGDLAMAGRFPVVLSSPGHVVYSAHDYGPDLFQQSWFNSSTTRARLYKVWHKFWGYLYTKDKAPIWVGEFGTGNTSSDVSSTSPGSQGQWFSTLASYLKANRWIGWTYWALNGEDSYALLDNGYDPTPVSSAKRSTLASIRFPLSAG